MSLLSIGLLYGGATLFVMFLGMPIAFALGAVATVESASDKQTQTVHSGSSYCSQSDLALTFGLGKDDAVKSVTIQWPSGHKDVMNNVKANQYLTVREGLK